MPYYDYTCFDCNDSFEAKRSFAEAHIPAACPDCQGENTKKRLTRINVNEGAPKAKRSAMPMRPSQATAGLPSCGPGGCACHGMPR